WPAHDAARRWQTAQLVGAAAVFVTASLALHEAKLDYDPEVTGAERVFGAGQMLDGFGISRGRMLIWGWMPQLYVWSGWTPATRDTVTAYQILPTGARPYFRDRMMAELRDNPPDYIVDAVAPGSFGFIDPGKDGLESFPELAAFVEKNYVLSSAKSLAV